MIIEFPFLDVVWRGLVLGALASTLFFLAMALPRLFLKRTQERRMKWYLNFQALSLLSIVSGSFVVLALGDPQLISRCFDGLVQSGSSSTITRWISGVWLLGVFVLFSKDAFSIIITHQRVRKASILSDNRLNQVLSELKDQMGFSSEVVLRSLPGSFSPFAYGFFQPTVILPVILTHQGVDEKLLRATLAHELMHLKDNDSFWLLVVMIYRRLFFWHPLAHLVSRQFRMQIELSADEATLAKTRVSRKELSQALVKITAMFCEVKTSPLTPLASRGFQELSRRIEALEHKKNYGHLREFSTLTLCSIFSISLSVAEAKEMLSLPQTQSQEGAVCEQASHERLIDSWIGIKPDPLRSER